MIRDHNLHSYPSNKAKPVPTSVTGKTIWAVIFDRQEARIFEKDGVHFHAVWSIDNFQPVADGISNATVGRGGSYGQGRHKYEPSMEQSKQHEIGFAKDLANWLDRARTEERFDEFVVAASPQMLGELLKNFSAPLQKCMVGQSSTNMMDFNGKELEEHLLKVVPGPAKE